MYKTFPRGKKKKEKKIKLILYIYIYIIKKYKKIFNGKKLLIIIL